MITNRPLPPPTPTPLCAAYAQHLPLLRAHELEPDQADALNNHLAECAWCQSMLVTYGIVDEALGRHFGPGQVAPSAVTMEEIVRATNQEDRISPSDSDDEPVATDLRTPPPRRWLQRQRRLLSGLAAVAAVLLVALLAEVLLALHQPPTGGQPVRSLRAVQTGRFTEYALPIPTRIFRPSSIVAGQDGALWFTETNMGAIGRLSPNGAYTEFALPQSDSAPNGLALGPDGNLWFTEWFGDKIGRITPAGKIIEFALPGAANYISGLTAITAGPDGNLWFGEQQSDRVGRITPQGSITEFRLTLPGSGPTEMTAGPDGNLWFTEQDGNRIGRITPQGSITEFPLPHAGSMTNGEQMGICGWCRESGQGPITKGPDGNLWFVEFGINAVGRITPQGLLTEFPLPTSNSGPDGITTGPDGGLWFTEWKVDKIGRLGP